MLVLSRRAQQQIVFPGLGITLSVLQVRGRIVKLGIEAPRHVKIKRNEVEYLPDPAPQSSARTVTSSVSTANDKGSHDEREHHRRNQLNTLQLYIDAVQMRLERGDYVDAKKLVQTLVNCLDLEDYEVATPSPVPANEVSENARQLRVLVVENSDNERGLMTFLLASHGFIVYVARDGAEALEQLRRGCGLPDVVLMDIDMPFANGHEALRRFRQDETLSDLLIYAVTGSHRNPADEPVGRSWDRWFAKPVNVQQLVDAIREDCLSIESPSLVAQGAVNAHGVDSGVMADGVMADGVMADGVMADSVEVKQ
ncbi:Polar-differentiation response regulator DivK [Rubripirellula amarantea]|uniref:Translational regulator CsrA n=1 Tax=Rubripirellula amarantea TaxID=2527999 RepID=A0A5C5WJS0_9BACT|nr:response regulator [Rubripirellula amarantea]TWT50213.1 Polar-differentiation response regulator DivK [Rubripirellula amarantea]